MNDSLSVLSTTELSFSYGERNTVDRVNLQLQAGTLTALVGPNGAGKSTLLHLLEGRLKPSQGMVNSTKPIGLMPQRAAIDWSFPINSEIVSGRSHQMSGSATAGAPVCCINALASRTRCCWPPESWLRRRDPMAPMPTCSSS